MPTITSKPGIRLDTSQKRRPTRDLHHDHDSTSDQKSLLTGPPQLPPAKSSTSHPSKPTPNKDNASLLFIGTATTILSWNGLVVMTDPNFLHAGDHVHLGPGVTATRKTNPAIELDDLPHVDLVLLSHYHGDHFDQVVEERLRRDLPIVTTPHAYGCLTGQKKGEDAFTQVHAVDNWEQRMVDFGETNAQASRSRPRVRVTGLPGKHVGDGLLSKANDLLGAVPPTNGWMLELGYGKSTGREATVGETHDDANTDFETGYRIYISGDTLYVNELEKIPEMYTHAGKPIDLMLIHLGGTTIPGPSMPLLMVTMDAEQGVRLVKLVQPDVTVPIHYDDYDVFMSPLSDFKAEMVKAGLEHKAVYLDRGEEFTFKVRGADKI